MRRALVLAAEAAALGEVPVGAVVVDPSGQVVGEAHNRTRELSDPTAHAEVLAIRDAALLLGDWRLEGHVLYTTLEPCAMCAGAIVLARLRSVVYGCADLKAGMCGSLGNIAYDARLNHRARVIGGVLEEASRELLQSFFRERRARNRRHSNGVPVRALTGSGGADRLADEPDERE